MKLQFVIGGHHAQKNSFGHTIHVREEKRYHKISKHASLISRIEEERVDFCALVFLSVFFSLVKIIIVHFFVQNIHVHFSPHYPYFYNLIHFFKIITKILKLKIVVTLNSTKERLHEKFPNRCVAYMISALTRISRFCFYCRRLKTWMTTFCKSYKTVMISLKN